MSEDPIRVHRTKCRGYGICAELLPERIRLDDWGYPIVNPRPVPAELMELAALAVRECPTAALILGAPTEDG
jgi:ferredoxin